MSVRAIWCLGMYASASTWLFNVVRQVLEVAQQDAVRAMFVSGEERRIALDVPGAVTVIKSHEIKSESRTVDVVRHSRKILISVRDPRDAVTSLIEAHKYDFDRALDLVAQSAALCMSFAKDRRAILFRYETDFAARQDTVVTVAKHLGYTLAEAQAQSIFASLTRREVEKYIGKMPEMPGILKAAESGDLLDLNTQWHSHHAGRSGEIGKWKKTLTAKQVAGIENRLGFCFAMTHAD